MANPKQTQATERERLIEMFGVILANAEIQCGQKHSLQFVQLEALKHLPIAGRERERGLREALVALADKWDSSDYAIAEVNNPLLPQEQCAIELRAALAIAGADEQGEK